MLASRFARASAFYPKIPAPGRKKSAYKHAPFCPHRGGITAVTSCFVGGLEFRPEGFDGFHATRDPAILEELNQVLTASGLVGIGDSRRLKAPVHGSLDCEAVKPRDSAAPCNLGVRDVTVAGEDQIEHYRTREALFEDRERERWRWFRSPLRLRRTRSQKEEDGRDRAEGCEPADMALFAHERSMMIIPVKSNAFDGLRTDDSRHDFRSRAPGICG